MPQKLYFAYGSNLNQKDFNEGCRRKKIDHGLLRFHSRANLPDFDLGFSYNSTTRKGGVLDLKPRIGQLVPGVLFEVDSKGWEALDLKEGSPNIYEKMDVQVLNRVGEVINAITYRVCDENKEHFVRPNEDYLAIVREGQKDWGIGSNQLDAVALNLVSKCPDGFFFYGTLMRGENRFPILQQFGLRCMLLAETFGRLLDLGSFPALIDTGSSNQMVKGDFVRLRKPEQAIRKLDQVEGYDGSGLPNSLFRRTYVGVGVGDGRIRYGWTYCLANIEKLAPQVLCGDWRQHLGHLEQFLKNLVSRHSDADESTLARRIAERTIWRNQSIEELAKTFLPLEKSLRLEKISERRMAQSSGKWTVNV